MFILPKDFDEKNPRDLPLIKTRYEEYEKYLESISEKLPSSAREFALAEWRHNPTDHRCPHDSGVEYINIFEHSSGERNQIRVLNIDVRLLGAYHDGYLDLKYKRVANYELTKKTQMDGHGDWLYDEVRLSDENRVLHEIEFVCGTTWLIDCEDIEFSWLPKAL